MSTPTTLDQIRMMPREVPRDPLHKKIIDDLVRGRWTSTQSKLSSTCPEWAFTVPCTL